MDIEELVGRLRKRAPSRPSYLYGEEGERLINPDGPEAATALEALQAENKRLREVLEAREKAEAALAEAQMKHLQRELAREAEIREAGRWSNQ